MKNALKLVRLFALALLVTTYGCSKDDEVNYKITTQDVTITFTENPTNGDIVGTVEAEGNGTLSFSITSQTPTGALNINNTTGELTVADATLFDFETNPVITANITVSNSEKTESLIATINLSNINELSIDDFSETIGENPTNGDVIGTVQATGDGTLVFSINSQTPSGALSINATTGELTVADATLFDFETNPTITADITVDNSVSTETAVATIDLTNVIELSIEDFTGNIDENPTNGDVIGTVQAVGDGTVAFGMTTQSPTGALSINTVTGELTVADATLFDFETNPTITANIWADNGRFTRTATATISLNNINEVGDYSYGGVIFWIDPASNNSAGLVCAVSNTFISGTWGCSGTTTGATGTAIGTGSTNTDAIVASGCAAPGSVIEAVSNLNLNGYDDWFLPSEDELIEIYTNISTVNAAITANGGQVTYQFHWSSTEINTTAAKLVNLTTGTVGGSGKNGNSYFARAVRAFTDF